MSVHVETGCLLCGRTAGDEPLSGGLLRRCLACGFAWTAGSGPALSELYDASYFESGGYQNYFDQQAQRRYEAGRRLRWLMSATRPESLLEAGCAGGFFLEAARRAGIAVEGVEPAEVCVRFAKEQLNLSVRQGSFEGMSPAGPVDAVCAFHVLEHVEDPRVFMSTARSVLAPGGWLALEVPNIASAAARRQGRSWHGLQLPYHRWHFTPQTLSRLVENHGFQVRSCDTVPVNYYLRPRYWLGPRSAWMLIKELASGPPRRPHPRRHDLLRLLARLPGRHSS